MAQKTQSNREYTIMYFLLKYKSQFLISSLAGIIYNTVIVLSPILLGKLIDAAATGTSKAVILSGMSFIMVTIFFQFSRYIKRWFMRDQFNHVACEIRQTLMDNILAQDLSHLQNENVGDLITRTVGDVTLVVDTVMSSINEGWDTWLLMLSYFSVLMYMDWKLTLLASLLVPVTLTLAHFMKNRLYHFSMQSRKLNSKANSGLQRYLSAIWVLRLFGREDAEKIQISEAFESQVKWNIKQTLLQQSLLPIYALLAGIGVVLVLGLGSIHVKNNFWSIGTFNAYIMMFVAFSSRTRVAAKVFNRWHSAKAAWTRVKEKLGCESEPLIPNPIKISQVKEVTFENLTFSIGNQVILENMNFEVKAGEIIGITGPVGSGKTSLLNMFFSQNSYVGNLKINSVPIRNMPLSQRSKIISYSGHEQFLFSMNLEDNIYFGEDRDEIKCRDILKLSGLESDIVRFDEGLLTMVGERGSRVSGGQRQRISMARALYKKTPIVLLDDPFSALDIRTEEKIVEAIKDHFKNQIVFISSHRLTSFKNMSRIIVLDKGKIVEYGTHEALFKSNGLYKEIYKAQEFLKEGNAHV